MRWNSRDAVSCQSSETRLFPVSLAPAPAMMRSIGWRSASIILACRRAPRCPPSSAQSVERLAASWSSETVSPSRTLIAADARPGANRFLWTCSSRSSGRATASAPIASRSSDGTCGTPCCSLAQRRQRSDVSTRRLVSESPDRQGNAPAAISASLTRVTGACSTSRHAMSNSARLQSAARPAWAIPTAMNASASRARRDLPDGPSMNLAAAPARASMPGSAARQLAWARPTGRDAGELVVNALSDRGLKSAPAPLSGVDVENLRGSCEP